jgi:fructose-specific PTS system IIA-like component
MPEVYEYRFVCPLPNGMHARPANCLEQVVAGFTESQVSLTNLSNQKTANARSILSLVGADIKAGDECVLRVEGENCGPAYREIVQFLKEKLPSCDDVLPPAAFQSEAYIPPVLRAAEVPMIFGCKAVSGFGKGNVVIVEALKLPAGIDPREPVRPEQELRKIEKAVAEHRSDITIKLGSGRLASVESKVLEAHLSIASDVEFLDRVRCLIRQRGICAGQAIIESFEYFSGILKSARSELIRERVVDLQDVCSHLLKKIYGSAASDQIMLSGPSVCVADNLTPSQFISMDKTLLSGLVLMHGGNTSHTVILARSFGIPTVTGIKDAAILSNGQEVVVDATYGIVITRMNAQAERYYAAQRRKQEFEHRYFDDFRSKPAKTVDGVRLEVMANVATADEVLMAMSGGAEGIGLFRTEMLFMGRDSAPSEDEQFSEYKKAAEYAAGKPVIIRTFDIGGDKSVSYLNLTSEDNPFLGYRGARVYREYEGLLKNQLRAILRASAFGCLKIMIPMVSCLEEVTYVRSLLDRIKTELDVRSLPYDKSISLGIMVEVPSVVFVIPQLAGLVDFLSIGTNDLTQYFLAIDRGNERVSALYQSRHPGLLGLIQKIVEDAHRHKLWVGMCGEMAGQVDHLPLLLGAGLDEVSVSIPAVAAIKARCADYDSRDCRMIFERAVSAKSAGQVDMILAERQREPVARPVIELSLIDLDADCINKEEAIQYATDMLYYAHRTEKPAELEQDFWQRESVYSTGLGYGFAVPHCKTNAVCAHSICLLRLSKPIVWKSIDDNPVDIVIAMTIRDGQTAGDAHMKIFSKLARHIMHDDFRGMLRSLQDRQAVLAYLQEKLAL